MDQSMSTDHNHGLPFIPSHLYQRNNSEVVHHVPLGYVHALQPLLSFLSEDVSAETETCSLFVGVSAV